MKRYFLILPLAIAFCSCNAEKDNKIAVTPEVGIIADTLIKGTPGEKGSSFQINYVCGEDTIKRYMAYWETKNLPFIRHQYYFKNNDLRLVHDTGYIDGRYEHSFAFRNDSNNVYISIDSIFNSRKRIKEIKVCVNKGGGGRYNFTFNLEKEFANGRLCRFAILDFSRSLKFAEKNGEYYEVETDVPLGYSEWTESTKSRFGRAYGDAMNSFAIALSKIDRKYIELLKEEHGIDATAFSL